MRIEIPIPELETPRLKMVAIQENHLDGFCEIWSDEETCKYIGGVQSRSDSWFAITTLVGHWFFRGYGLWVLIDKETQGVAGWSGIWNPEGWPEPELIWTLNKKFHGKGYATEAASTCRKWAYQERGLGPLISIIAPDNQASERVALRLGAQKEKPWQLRGKDVTIWRHPSPGDTTP